MSLTDLIATIEKKLWDDRGLEAFEDAKHLKENYPHTPEVTELLAKCAAWTGHTISKEAYTSFYAGHRTEYVPQDMMISMHERVPRLGLIREWMMDHPPKSILDLGCFDGFALINLVLSTGAVGFGVDLDQGALGHASKTSTGLGLEMKWVHSLAEELELGMAFDAVLVMELLEHVIDPIALMVAAEKHLAPGGRIYITTPGTPVPHFENEREAREHVRCLTKDDIREIVGDRIIERYEVLKPHQHDEQVLCYRRPRVTMVVNPIAGGWSPRNDLSYRGSEEGVVCLAEELGNNGYEVTAYVNTDEREEKEFAHKSVLWRDHSRLELADPSEITIVSKWPDVIDVLPETDRLYYWTTDPNKPEDFPPHRLERITRIVALTDWHKKELIGLNPDIPDEKFISIPYGLPEMQGQKVERNPKAMIYASSFDRGLAWFLDHWAEIRERVPDAELHVWYGWSMYNKIFGLSDDGVVTKEAAESEPSQWKATMWEKMQQPGIKVRGECTPYDATPFLEVGIWAYPCTGGERFCITGKKAQALGAVPVIVPTMALSETVQYGIKTDHENYVASLVNLLGDVEGQEVFRKTMAKAHHTGWAEIFELFWRAQWADMFAKIGKAIRRARLPAKRQTVTTIMMTYNAESMLLRTLKSIKDVTDELIVVDGGSTDLTLEMLKEYGAKIIEGTPPHYCLKCKEVKEPDHFGETNHEPFGFEGPRNQGLNEATGDWILWIDSDEELQSPEGVKKYFRPNMFNAYAVHQHHFTIQPPNAFRPDLPCRIFRNGLGIRFFGKVHEHPEIMINEGITPACIMDIHLAHSGYYMEDVRRKKFRRNIGLMKADRRKYQHRTLGRFLWLRDLIHLTRYEIETNGMRLTRKAMEYCNEAIELYDMHFVNKANLYGSDGWEYYSEACRIINRGLDTRWAVETSPGEAPMPDIKHVRFSSLESFQKALNAYAEAKWKQYVGKYI